MLADCCLIGKLRLYSCKLFISYTSCQITRSLGNVGGLVDWLWMPTLAYWLPGDMDGLAGGVLVTVNWLMVCVVLVNWLMQLWMVGADWPVAVWGGLVGWSSWTVRVCGWSRWSCLAVGVSVVVLVTLPGRYRCSESPPWTTCVSWALWWMSIWHWKHRKSWYCYDSLHNCYSMKYAGGVSTAECGGNCLMFTWKLLTSRLTAHF